MAAQKAAIFFCMNQLLKDVLFKVKDYSNNL